MQFPVHGGVIPKHLVDKYLEWPPAERDLTIQSLGNGAGVDTLVVLICMVLSLGQEPETPEGPALFDIAFHDFGIEKVADFIMKGEILVILFPGRAHKLKAADIRFESLMEHPLIRSALWSHGTFTMHRRDTWARKSNDDA
ncbi:hypothetical protein B0H63DRAFT_482144 [Podospora didyma]|uniref:Uncharacterized protein n=1 Tax=Podospora didyma TaxID=330526 RepID=A0AAE0KEI8_9PEZI|nr:hypothetical protein B0H63DRAFT_482144 [Podospora didyma]